MNSVRQSDGISRRLRGLFGSRHNRREQRPTITCAVCGAKVTEWSPLAECDGEDSDPELTLDMSDATTRELDDAEMAADLADANERLGAALCGINEALGLARGASAATTIDWARKLCAAYRAQAERQDEVDRRLTYIRGLVPGDLGGATVLASGVEDRARAVLDALAGEVAICLDGGGLSLSWGDGKIVVALMPDGRVAVLIDDQDLVPDAPKSGGNHAECVMSYSATSPAPSGDDTAPHWRCSCGDWQMAVEPWPLEVVGDNTAEAQRSWAAHAEHRLSCTPLASGNNSNPRPLSRNQATTHE